MSDDDSVQAYLSVANQLYMGNISEAELPIANLNLPSLDKSILDLIAQQAESLSATKPRKGWALVEVAHSASLSQHSELFLQSLSAWYLARACNHWTQPKRVNKAVSAARHGFEKLNEIGWIAACDWQLNAQAWTRPNFAEAAHGLEEALKNLEAADFTEFITECRLAFAYAQILVGEYQEAWENIRLCEETHIARIDSTNQARCWLHQASSLRRQGHFGKAFQKLEQALEVFEKENASTEQAKAHYQIALGHLLQENDLPKAISHFKKAAGLFNMTELDLWHATCINNLGAVYMANGELQQAHIYYEEAGACYAQHETLGPLADNLSDRGKLNVLMGKPTLGITQLKQSEAINLVLGSRLPTAIAISNLGEAYGQLGRYQDALHHLERAAEQLKSLGIYFRLATCEKYMASIWSRLGQPHMAHQYLDASAMHYEMADQKAFLASIYNHRAATFFQQGHDAEAITALKSSLKIASEYGIRPQVALAKQLLGEALLRSANPDEASGYLQEALDDFSEMGMSMNQAACLVSLGAYYQMRSKPEQAKTSFNEALRVSEKTSPETDWRAYFELGNLAEIQGDIKLALTQYAEAAQTFRDIRQNFLQPALAGSYLQTPARAFDRMIEVASQAGAALDALNIVEETKASTLLHHLSANNTLDTDSFPQELDALKAEIELLRSQLRVTLEATRPLQSVSEACQTRAEIRRKTEQYIDLKMQLERRSLSEGSRATTASFDLDAFRKKASLTLENDWVALDYYLTKNELITLIITPDICMVELQSMTYRVRMALEACERAHKNTQPPQESDLRILGKLLIPDSITDALSPDTYLLLAPHRDLHQIPWSALQPEFASQPLASICIPCIVPSLQALTLLWERRESLQPINRNTGLLVGVSSFQGLHEELPQVKNEITALSTKLGVDGCTLTEDKATWENLLTLRNGGNIRPNHTQTLTRFAWLHIASHFSPDRHTGRLSGIALSDGDIWLDQLLDLAPLPALVSLSACNSNDTFLHEGDERTDLQTTCFTAGAATVIGSAWPVSDQAAAELMILFYEHFMNGRSPAKAVASAQRQFVKAGKDLKSWASFLCAGCP